MSQLSLQHKIDILKVQMNVDARTIKDQERQIQQIQQIKINQSRKIQELELQNKILKESQDFFAQESHQAKQNLSKQKQINFLLNKEMDRITKDNEQLQNQINPPLGKIQRSDDYIKQVNNPTYQSLIRSQSRYYQEMVSLSRIYNQSNHKPQAPQMQTIPEVKTIDCRLFQQFLIIGGQKNQISLLNNQHVVKPEIQYEYSSDQKQILNANEAFLGNFFPFGNRTQPLEDIDDVREIIFSGIENKLKNYLQIFIVSTAQDQTLFDYIILTNIYMELALQWMISHKQMNNFTNIRNHIVFQHIFQQLNYFKKFYVISLLLYIYLLDQMKIKRNQLQNEQNIQKLIDLDGFEIIKQFNDEFSENLKQINEFKIYKENSTIDINVNYNLQSKIQISYRIPGKEEISNTMMKWSAQIVFKLFNAEQIQQIYLYLLLEQNIVFISENQQNLSASIQFFLDILSPIKWEHQLIFSINEAIVNDIKNQDNNKYIIGINRNSKDVYKLLKGIDRSQSNIILVHIDKLIVDKIEIMNKLQAQIIRLPIIQELQNFRQNFTENWKNHRFLLNTEKMVLQLLEQFKIGINQFLFDKIIPNRDRIIKNDIYNMLLLQSLIEQQFEPQDRQFLRYFLESNNFEKYIKSK